MFRSGRLQYGRVDLSMFMLMECLIISYLTSEVVDLIVKL